MKKDFPRQPRHPERICWGCDRRCPISDLACGEEKARAPHPIELFGEDWFDTPVPAPGAGLDTHAVARTD